MSTTMPTMTENLQAPAAVIPSRQNRETPSAQMPSPHHERWAESQRIAHSEAEDEAATAPIKISCERTEPADPDATADAVKYSPQLKAIVERAMQGDRSVLPELKKAYDENPEWVNLYGDLFEHARDAHLAILANNDLMTKEAIVRKLNEMRTALKGEGCSPLESLLVDQICLDWLATQHSDLDLSGKLTKNRSADPGNKAAQQRLDAAHRRFQNAVKTLATVRMLRPNRSTLDMLNAGRPDSKDKQAGVKRDILPVSEGIPILN